MRLAGGGSVGSPFAVRWNFRPAMLRVDVDLRKVQGGLQAQSMTKLKAVWDESALAGVGSKVQRPRLPLLKANVQ